MKTTKTSFLGSLTCPFTNGSWAGVLGALLFFSLIFVFTPNSVAQDYTQIDKNDSVDTNSSESDVSFTHKQIESLLTQMLHSPTPGNEGQHERAASETKVSYDQTLLSDWEADRSRLKISDRLTKLSNLLPTYPDELKSAILKIASPEAGRGFWSVISSLGLILLIGLFCEFVTTQKLLKQLYRFVEAQNESLKQKARFILARVVIQLIGITVLGIAIYVSSIFLLQPNRYLEVFFHEGLVALIKFRVWMIMLRNIYSPYREELRPIPIDNRSARQAYIWFTLFFAIIELGELTVVYLTTVGVDELLVKGLFIPYTLGLNLIILSQIWSQRDKITNMFTRRRRHTVHKNKEHHPNLIKEFTVHSWPFIFTSLVAFFMGVMVIQDIHGALAAC
ncbi:MAG: hypothetical protein GKR96_11630 [Gammaproteobacteria bacterium]|nr:hypothetical protein [Gammaproteobacteria bacterium]